MDGPRDDHTELSQHTETDSWYHLHAESQKKTTNEFISKTETELQMEKLNLCLPVGNEGRGINWKPGIDTYYYI